MKKRFDFFIVMMIVIIAMAVLVVLTIINVSTVRVELAESTTQITSEIIDNEEPTPTAEPTEEPFDRGYDGYSNNQVPQCEFVEYVTEEVTEVTHDWNYFDCGKQANSTFMGVHCITDKSSPQYQWLHSHEWTYNDENICEYNGRILVALTPYFGEIGDQVDLLLQDGSVLEVIIADYKGKDAKSKYGHIENGYVNVIELLVHKSWYKGHENKQYGKVIAYENKGGI